MMSMLPPGELWWDAGRRIRTGRAWRVQCVAASIRGASKYIFTCSSIWLPATRRCSFAFVQPAWPPRMQSGIAKLILNGYTDRLFLLFLLLFVPSSDISLGIAMASMDWARPSISADLGAILSLLGSPDAHSRPSSGPCDANHLHSQLMKN